MLREHQQIYIPALLTYFHQREVLFIYEIFTLPKTHPSFIVYRYEIYILVLSEGRVMA